ncbi:hypothetical protein [Paracoccus sp. PAR01]|uniref:hypothetical protein n=1 Tax=Paracoccus sp. PAR01 TaxID=2769282 RepID=UPI001783A406|nr:hypothetical protein [Paracoccus sp. PAR01]MBD9528995.1 hypothetical protein [Paracoccus sp. PAR01]
MRQQIYSLRGVDYVGIAAVAKAAGVHPNTVFNHLRKYGDLDVLGKVTEIEVDGRTWPSIREFARYVGRDYTNVRRWFSDGRGDLIRRRLAEADGVRA